MEPRIENRPETTLVGKRTTMSFAFNRTRELWQNFMPSVTDIKNTASPELYSVEVYKNPQFFEKFNPANEFEKWAAIKISHIDSVPPGMEAFKIPAGLYAVFPYKGKASEASKAYQYIFGTWMPNADYLLDDRPHFTIMGEKYRNEDPDSEEEIWIPVKKKQKPANMNP